MRFMITTTWKQPPNEEVMALIPAEEARINELIEQGVQEISYSAADQSTFWVVWKCASPDEVQKTVQTLPLHKFTNVEILALTD